MNPPMVQIAGDMAVPAPRGALTPGQRDEMFALMDSHFEGMQRDVFNQDLDEKDWALRILRDGALVGFSTLQAYTTQQAGREVSVIYSGDTVVSPQAWSTPVLSRGWIALVRAMQATRLDTPWYWLLLSSGFRTYRFLPVFWREFWPRFDSVGDDTTRGMVRALARERFDGCYDESAGVVRFPRPQRLRGHLNAIPEGREHDPHIRFFLERNPGHNEGDELVCLTELSDANLTAAGQRMVRGSTR
ncbi:MAG TPA: hypothetical protein VFZ73_02215 [Gemmatimonadaceae bacterium]